MPSSRCALPSCVHSIEVLARIGGIAADVGDLAAIATRGRRRPRAAPDKAPTSGSASPARRRHSPAADRTARCRRSARSASCARRNWPRVMRVRQLRIDRVQRLDGVRADIEPGAGFGMVVARHPLEAGHLDALELRSLRAITHPATPAPTMTIRISRQPLSCEAMTAIRPPPSGP